MLSLHYSPGAKPSILGLLVPLKFLSCRGAQKVGFIQHPTVRGFQSPLAITGILAWAAITYAITGIWLGQP